MTLVDLDRVNAFVEVDDSRGRRSGSSERRSEEHEAQGETMHGVILRRSHVSGTEWVLRGGNAMFTAADRT